MFHTRRYKILNQNCNERVAVSLVPGQQTLGYRYMYEKLTEKGDLLDERIRYFEPLLAADHLARLLSQEQSVLAGDEMQIDGGITIKKETDATQIDEQVKSQELLDPDMDPLLLVTSPSHPFQNTHFYVGRICIDSLAISSSLRLNDKSLLLEPSRFTGSGVRVNLNLAPLVAAGGGYSLFPGQIVGIEATNPSGRSLNVSKLHLPPQLPIPTSNTTQLRNYYPSTKSNQSTHIVTASGPYALSDSLWFEPLADLVATLIKDTPDVLILLGPFVSINHPLIENGMIDMSPNEIFKQRIAPILKQLVDSTALKNGEAGGVQIILVPSTSDACSEYLAFPQPPLASAPIAASADAYNNRQRLADMGLDTLGTNVLLFPNPVQFTVNELVVCVSSIDTVFDINQAQLTHAATAPAATETGVLGKSDRIAGVFQHVLNQRCLYPLYPPASGANLDTTRALSIISTTPTAIKAEIPDMDTHMADENDQPPTGATQLVAIPDILIIPSRLQPTTKQIGQTLCVNPGHMTKNGSGKSAGGYARIVVHGFEIPEDAGTNDEVVEHCVADRARVQIMRV